MRLSEKWRPGAAERLTLATVLAGLVLLLVYTDALWRWDRVFYDLQLRLWQRPTPDDIVIVAIDEATLREFGRWPWSRQVHAGLLSILSEEQPRAIGFDVIFAETNLRDPDGDARFARAIRASGRVALPVLMEQTHSHGHPIETLPLPALANVAAALGHVHVELDPDGIARELFLYEGLGSPHWTHLSLALMQIAGETPQNQVAPDTRNGTGSPLVWYRQTPMLIPFAGPPGHFQRISYAQVVQKKLCTRHLPR